MWEPFDFNGDGKVSFEEKVFGMIMMEKLVGGHERAPEQESFAYDATSFSMDGMDGMDDMDGEADEYEQDDDGEEDEDEPF